MIAFEHVSKVFKTRETEVHALDDISLTVEDGDIFGVIGFSGAGKSTLIRMVNKLEVPTVGRVLIDGRDVASYPKQELRSFRHNIGMIFQHFNLLESRTVEQNIAMPLQLIHEKKDVIAARVQKMLRFVELEDKAKAYPSQLSGGQKQRVGIARALATEPSILLCDEATSALDPRTTESILQLLTKVNRELNVTILMITHQMNVIQQVCNKVAVLESGKIVEQGRVIDVFGNPQSDVTKGFVRTVINDRIPDEMLAHLRAYQGAQRVLRLRFDGQNADDPVMSDAIKETGANISIICGIVTELEGRIIGFQTVQITGTQEQVAACESYLDKRNVGKQVITL